MGIHRLHLSDHHHQYRYLVHPESHRRLNLQGYWLYHLDQNLIGFHSRLRYHRHHDLNRYYHPFHPSLNQTIPLHHEGRHRLHLSDHHHRYRYLMHPESHHRLDLLVYWLCRSDQNQAGLHTHLKCHRHHDLGRYYPPFRLSPNLPIQLHHAEIDRLRLSDRLHRCRHR